ncbi:F-box/kelch-repeat protein At3g06240-like [Salvia miltiorrhiza]|uniref:F-box/kelch-repeat protein At3g06240-like n=1 Tax=Salvia miltiorrhiza TaxID=226208 RepID=UPI0025AB9F5E|nr:F-box/kelch-repeat protein At3g06240-like [Salvia miltiorrhiza]
MSDYFPADLWIEILIKLPVKSLIRFTAVSKSWRSLITSPNFNSVHLSNAKNRALLRRYDKHDKHEHYHLLEFAAKNGAFGINSCSEFEFPLKSQIGYFRIVGSCDGLVCLTDDFFLYPSQPVILWNPSVRNRVILPQAITNPKGPHIVVLGFGVANGVYKVVRLVYCRKPDDYGFGVPPQAEIFSLGAGRWRKVWGFDIKLRILEFMWCQVLLNGVVHWLGYEPIDDDHSSRSSILAFEIDNEVFGEVMLPDLLAKEAVNSLCLFASEGSLALVKYSSASEIEACDVWIMKEYGVKKSWMKLYRIDLAGGFERVVGFRNGEALLAIQGLDLVAYNLESRRTQNLGIYGTPRSFYIDKYVESLLLLKGKTESAEEDLDRDALEGLSLE